MSSGEPDEKAFQALLVEYTSLLQSIDRKTTVIVTLITFDVSAVAGIIGFILRQGDTRLLVMIPMVSSIIGLLVASQDHDVRTAEDYVESTLRPAVLAHTRDKGVWRWSEHLVYTRGALFVAITRAVPLGVLFPGLAVVSTVVVMYEMQSAYEWLVWTLGAVLTGLLILGWLDHADLLLRRLSTTLRGHRADSR